ncbi:MAG: pseudouridine synthase [Nannocystaceae bacterium]
MSSAPRTIEVRADDNDDGQRADVVLARHVADLSRRVARRLALAGGLRIEGRRAPPSTRIQSGHRLELGLPESANDDAGAVVVLAVTPDVVYVDKPAGLHTVALTPGQVDCLATGVGRLHPECATASPDRRECGALHRLDRDTSGVVAFARHREAWTRGRASFSTATASKRYLALCTVLGPGSAWPPPHPTDSLPDWITPVPDLAPESVGLAVFHQSGAEHRGLACRVRAPLGRGSVRGIVAVRLDGQRASTLIQPLSPPMAPQVLCEIDLETGHRHQARVHLAWLGMTIVGDPLYGSGSDPTRLMLHALSLDLRAAFADDPIVATTSHTDLFRPFLSS